MVKITIASKNLHSGIVHNFIEKGGTIIFSKYNFGIEIGGKGNFREIRLITFPEQEQYKTVINTGTKKKSKPAIGPTEEDEVEEL